MTLLALCLVMPVAAEETQEILNTYTEFYGDIFEDELEGHEGFTALFQQETPKELLGNIIKGKIPLSFQETGRILLRFLLGEVYTGGKAMLMVLLLSILCSYLVGLKDGFGAQGVTTAAFYVCYLVIAGITAAAFYQTAECVGQTVEQIAVFMKMIVPLVITALMSCGAVVSASVFEPILITVIEFAVSLVQTVLIPLVMTTTGLQIVNHMSNKFKINKLIKFLNQCIKWMLSIMLTVFVSVAGMQSIAAGNADALSVKLSKFAASNLIPVVGGILAESVETIMNCSVLIKNAVGVFGIICLGVMAVFPLLKVAAILILFRLTAAVCEPVSDPKILSCVSELANATAVLFSILAAVTAMFIIALTIVIHAGNSVVMLGR